MTNIANIYVHKSNIYVCVCISFSVLFWELKI